jgi:hypothetical protein
MISRIAALTALGLGTLVSVTVWGQATTPGGGPNSGVKDAVHPPSVSAPNASQHVPAPTSASKSRAAHRVKAKRGATHGSAGATSSSSSAPH